MKKVSLLILLVIVLSTVLMAAVPTKTVRLTLINKSGDDVYMKLEGSEITEAFYYLTVPAGDRDEPTVKVFTVLVDLYSRTTWQCGGENSGQLLVDGNIRLVFTPCGKFLALNAQAQYRIWVPGFGWQYSVGTLPAGWVGDPTLESRTVFKTMAGEPTQEKVVRFRYLSGPGVPDWSISYLYTGYLNWGCATWYWRARTYSRPNQCNFRYQY
jgi:hypothetical protein